MTFVIVSLCMRMKEKKKTFKFLYKILIQFIARKFVTVLGKEITVLLQWEVICGLAMRAIVYFIQLKLMDL